jgi:thiamine-phosphate pyrophosphorylase
MPLAFPRLYVIIGPGSAATTTAELARALASAGVELIQYRDKQATSRVVYTTGLEIVRSLKPFSTRLIINDRADVAALLEAGGVHVGQDDLPVAAARAIVGSDRWVGVSTHTLEQATEADATPADYLAFGPIFPTATKVPIDPTVGVDGLRRVRKLTRKPLVAIGGITLERAVELWLAGADSVAVARDVAEAADPAARARAYLELAAAIFGSMG